MIKHSNREILIKTKILTTKTIPMDLGDVIDIIKLSFGFELVFVGSFL